MKNLKIKEACKKCYFWTGKKYDGKYKCYCGDCPAKARDEKASFAYARRKQWLIRGGNKS